MKKTLTWLGRREGEDVWFPASVPGNIQNDYAIFNNWGDLNYGDNCLRYLDIEDDAWFYRAEFEINDEKNVYFVSGGIDYRYDISLNGEMFYSHEGMFSKVEENISDKLKQGKNVIEVKIYPHPKREGASGRSQADLSCKPPLCYGWDWHPRVLISGIWNDAYLEIRDADYINSCEVSYKLSGASAKVEFKVDDGCLIEIYSPSNELIYSGTDKKITIDNPLLWWCNGQGDANLYSYKVKKGTCEKCGKIDTFSSAHIKGKGGKDSYRVILPQYREFFKDLISGKVENERLFDLPTDTKKARLEMSNEIRRITKSLDISQSGKNHEFRKYHCQLALNYYISKGWDREKAEKYVIQCHLSHSGERQDLKKIYLYS